MQITINIDLDKYVAQGTKRHLADIDPELLRANLTAAAQEAINDSLYVRNWAGGTVAATVDSVLFPKEGR